MLACFILYFAEFRIRIHFFWIQGFDDQNLEKFTAENFLLISKIAIYLSLGLQKGRPSYSRSHKPLKENI